MYVHKYVWICGWRGGKEGGEDREKERENINHRSFPIEGHLKGVGPILTISSKTEILRFSNHHDTTLKNITADILRRILDLTQDIV